MPPLLNAGHLQLTVAPWSERPLISDAPIGVDMKAPISRARARAAIYAAPAAGGPRAPRVLHAKSLRTPAGGTRRHGAVHVERNLPSGGGADDKTVNGLTIRPPHRASCPASADWWGSSRSAARQSAGRPNPGKWPELLLPSPRCTFLERFVGPASPRRPPLRALAPAARARRVRGRAGCGRRFPSEDWPQTQTGATLGDHLGRMLLPRAAASPHRRPHAPGGGALSSEPALQRCRFDACGGQRQPPLPAPPPREGLCGPPWPRPRAAH
eukprot:scaffold998_cov411-Prasinococcus_capsulatus_cf.AAC.18